MKSLSAIVIISILSITINCQEEQNKDYLMKCLIELNLSAEEITNIFTDACQCDNEDDNQLYIETILDKYCIGKCMIEKYLHLQNIINKQEILSGLIKNTSSQCQSLKASEITCNNALQFNKCFQE